MISAFCRSHLRLKPSEEKSCAGRIAEPEGTSTHRGKSLFSPAEYNVQAGDQLRIWIEAQDGDDVSGPNLGQSEIQTLTIASKLTRQAEKTIQVEETLDAAIHALADRLEAPVPEAAEPARARFEQVRISTQRFSEKAESLSEQLDERDGALFRGIAQQVRRRLRAERTSYGESIASLPRRERLNRELVDELEKDVLRLGGFLRTYPVWITQLLYRTSLTCCDEK